MTDQISFDPEWEEIHSAQEWGAYPPEYVIRFFARNFYNKTRNEMKILDYGSGAGACTWYLAREGFDVYAFDGSKSAIRRTQERLRKENLKADLRVLDGVAIDYKDNLFDAILDNVCIYANTIPNIKRMYQQGYRVLKKGGRIITACFGRRTFGYGLGDKIEEGTYRNIPEGALSGRGVAHFYTEEEFFHTMQDSGFKNITIDTIFYTDRGIAVEQFIGYGEK